MTDAITIRQLTDYKDLLACEKLQVEAWKMTGDRDVVPAHMLSPIVENGGVVMGAVNGQGQIVGFVFGFVGRIHDERAGWIGSPYIFCSEMMGVLPEYRSAAVGTRLKLAQRDYALAQGYKLMTWTYDPLLSLNARLNIAKLGCIVRRYVRDAYGEMGGIYAGLSTDRFAVEWWLASQRVESALAADSSPTLADWLSQGLSVINSPSQPSDQLLAPGDYDLSAAPESFLVQIPAHFQTLKALDFAIAKSWRDHTRALFEEAFAHGHVITGFAGPDYLSSYYYLTRSIDVSVLAKE